MRLVWLLCALLLSAGLAVLHYLALTQSLYWYYVWLDVPVHFLGGLAIGMLVIAVLHVFRPWVFLIAIVGVLVGWELFELVIHTTREINFYFDTALDVLMGTLGALTAYSLARFTLWRSA